MWSYAVTVSSVEIYNEVLRYSMLHFSPDSRIYSYKTLFVLLSVLYFASQRPAEQGRRETGHKNQPGRNRTAARAGPQGHRS